MEHARNCYNKKKIKWKDTKTVNRVCGWTCLFKNIHIKKRHLYVFFNLLMQLELKLIRLWLTKHATHSLVLNKCHHTHATVSAQAHKQTRVVHLFGVEQKYVQDTGGRLHAHATNQQTIWPFDASESLLRRREKSFEPQPKVGSSGSLKKTHKCRCWVVENTTPYRCESTWRNSVRLQKRAQFCRMNNTGHLPQQHFLSNDVSPFIWGDSTKMP